jgi:hypothetical protein
VVTDKAPRVANYHRNTLSALAELIGAAGLEHPNQLRAHHIACRLSPNQVTLLSTVFPEFQSGELLNGVMRTRVFKLGWPMAEAHSFTPVGNIDEALAEINAAG